MDIFANSYLFGVFIHFYMVKQQEKKTHIKQEIQNQNLFVDLRKNGFIKTIIR